uniref:SEFIR domain-containing protein n=1 Tax=Ciona savignyi TaxID=51511 RepID=H2YL92_CIOSA
MMLVSPMASHHYRNLANRVATSIHKDDIKFNLWKGTDIGWFAHHVWSCRHIVLVFTPHCVEYMGEGAPSDSFHAGLTHATHYPTPHNIIVIYFDQPSKPPSDFLPYNPNIQYFDMETNETKFFEFIAKSSSKFEKKSTDFKAAKDVPVELQMTLLHHNHE